MFTYSVSVRRPSSNASTMPVEFLSPQVHTLNNTFVHEEGQVETKREYV